MNGSKAPAYAYSEIECLFLKGCTTPQKTKQNITILPLTVKLNVSLDETEYGLRNWLAHCIMNDSVWLSCNVNL